MHQGTTGRSRPVIDRRNNKAVRDIAKLRARRAARLAAESAAGRRRMVVTGVCALATVVLGIVMASSVMLIRNSFSISVAQRTRQFGLLSSIGATKRQLRGVVLREAAFLAAVGVPIGVLVGYAGTAAVLWGAQGLISSWIADWWGANPADVELRLAFSPLALLAAVALSVVTVMLSARGPARRAASFTAIDAIRSAADVRIPRRAAAGGRVAGRLFGVPGLVAAKSFRRDAKPRRATVAALTTGVVLVTTAVLLGGYLNALFSTVRPEVAAAQEGSYDIRYWFTEGDVEGYGDSRPTSEEACARIAGVEGTTRAVCASQAGICRTSTATHSGRMSPACGRALTPRCATRRAWAASSST